MGHCPILKCPTSGILRIGVPDGPDRPVVLDVRVYF